MNDSNKKEIEPIIEQKNVIEHPAEQKNVIEHPTEQKNIIEHPAEQKNVIEHPTEQKNVIEHPTEQKNVIEHPAEQKNIIEHPAENFNMVIPPRKPVNPIMKDHAPYFLRLTFIYAICFAFSFYRNFIGITYPLITIVTLFVCGLFLKKNNILWKKQNWWYMIGCVLLGISTVFTTNIFVIFFNTVGILLLITVFMIRQVYNDTNWSLGQYICNILFLYLCMIPEVASPFIHFANQFKESKKGEVKSKNGKYILIGILIGFPMVLIIIELLSSADQIFSEVVGNLFHKFWIQILFSPNVFLVIFLLFLGFFGIYCFLSALTLNNMPEWKQHRNKKNPITAITFLSMITFIYLMFCGIQMIFLFTGGKLLPDGYTYAEYAHQGFFQLLFLCMFNLILVVSCIAIFELNKVLKMLLLVFSGCTYIMIASSAYRMLLYIGVYHLSFLRVLVLWFLAMLVFLLAGIMINIVKENFQLFRYCMVIVSSFYLLFSFGRVDYFVASYNVVQMGENISYVDLVYLTNLSMDTTPILKQFDFEHENCPKSENYSEDVNNSNTENPTESISNDFNDTERESRQSYYFTGCKKCRLEWKFQKILDSTENMNLRTFHFSKYIARKIAKEYFDTNYFVTSKDFN